MPFVANAIPVSYLVVHVPPILDLLEAYLVLPSADILEDGFCLKLSKKKHKLWLIFKALATQPRRAPLIERCIGDFEVPVTSSTSNPAEVRTSVNMAAESLSLSSSRKRPR